MIHSSNTQDTQDMAPTKHRGSSQSRSFTQVPRNQLTMWETQKSLLAPAFDSAKAVATTWGISQRMKDLVSPSLCNCVFPIKINMLKEKRTHSLGSERQGFCSRSNLQSKTSWVACLDRLGIQISTIQDFSCKRDGKWCEKEERCTN